MTDAMTSARSKERTIAKGTVETTVWPTKLKGDLFTEAEFWSNSRVILNMRCNSVKVQESWLAGERNERNIF